MSKAFTREDSNASAEEDDLPPELTLPHGGRNYMTPEGFARLRAEYDTLLKRERPELVQVVAWAASNGDRSENGDYIYGKKRLREIDRRLRYLEKRISSAVVVDPAEQTERTRVFFGAWVTVSDMNDDAGQETRYQIVGIDEADAASGRISWISPLARAMMKRQQDDVIRVETPGGSRELEITAIDYNASLD